MLPNWRKQAIKFMLMRGMLATEPPCPVLLGMQHPIPLPVPHDEWDVE